MAFAAMLGAAVGVRRGTHFAFTSLGDALPKPLPAICRAAAQVSLLVAGAALVALGAQLAAADRSVKMAGAPLSAGLKFVPLCLGGALIALFAVEKLALAASRSEPQS
jgi:TRAP-type C4-dicarboxylate transport system permease small subunit